MAEGGGGLRPKESMMFRVIQAFIRDVADLLHNLSGRGLMSKPNKKHAVQREDEERFEGRHGTTSSGLDVGVARSPVRRSLPCFPSPSCLWLGVI